MKRIEVLLLLFVAVFASCKQGGKNIVVDIKNIPAQEVVLQEIAGPKFNLIDSLTIKKDQLFELSAPLSEEKMYRLAFQKGKNIMLSLKKGDKLKVESDWNTLEAYTISGSETSQAVKELIDARRQNMIDARTYKLIIDSFEARKDQTQIAKATKDAQASKLNYTTYLKSVASDSKSAVAALLAANVIDPKIDAPFVSTFYKEIQNRFPNNDLVKLYVDRFVGANKLEAAPVNTSKGNPAPDFSAQTPDGKTVQLADYKGKYVLVDFWASWCGPCRRENPSVVAAYEQFKGKNFDILGVSLDTDKENWKKAIAKDGLTWQQISELKGWSSSIAQKYQVNSIPANFLIDPDGYIIASGLRGQGLINKLKEVIK